LDLQRVSRPNLLFLVLDQWRFDWNGHADGPSLPTIDALGKSGAEGNMLELTK
jgi:arylsulfatase A-like enzyme